MSAGMFLCNATRFKLSFSTQGNVSCLQPYAKELEGRWVALVPADDGKHMSMAAERDRLKAANAELAAACEAVIKRADNYHNDFQGMRSIEAANRETSEALAKCRAALAKHKGETP